MGNNLPYKPKKSWYAVEFGFNNPTILPYTLDLFNGYSQTPIQTIPNPILNPTVVSATIPVGNNPIFTAYNTFQNTVYVANTGSNDVTVIDSINNSVITTISVGTNPSGIAYNRANNFIYVTNVTSNDVYIINCSTNTVVGSPIPTSIQPSFICYNKNSNTMYCACSFSNVVDVIDCNSNTVIASIPVGTNPNGLAYNSSNNTMYVINNGSNDVYIINCSTNTVVGSPIFIGFFSQPNCISYNSFSNNMYISCNITNNVFILSCSTNNFIGTPIPVGLVPFSLNYDSLTNKMYVANLASNNISIINCINNTVIGTIPVGTSPIGISYNSTNNTMYVSNNVSNDVSVITPLLPQVPYVSGTTDYNQFVTELQNTPKRARHMILTVQNYGQLAVPFNILNRDANGTFCSEPKIPTEYLDSNNYQPFICELPFKPKELVLDNNMIISQYTIAPNSTVKMVLYFDEIDMSDLLSEKLNVYNQIETKVEDLNTISEATLDRRYESRPIFKPEWLKNFKGGKVIKI